VQTIPETGGRSAASDSNDLATVAVNLISHMSHLIGTDKTLQDRQHTFNFRLKPFQYFRRECQIARRSQVFRFLTAMRGVPSLKKKRMAAFTVGTTRCDSTASPCAMVSTRREKFSTDS